MQFAQQQTLHETRVEEMLSTTSPQREELQQGLGNDMLNHIRDETSFQLMKKFLSVRYLAIETT